MKNCYWIAALLLAILPSRVFAQASSGGNNRPVAIPPTPNAASLGKFGEIPVSNYTGQPSTSIPLYTVTSKDLSLPISLNYHHNGIQLEEEASWVGLGWALNAGGTITRTIRGGDDLMPYGYVFNRFPEGLTLNNFDINYPGLATYLQQFYAWNGNLDTEPDIFYFNVGGVSGKFVLEALAQGASFPASGIKGLPLTKSNVSIRCYLVNLGQSNRDRNYRWEIVTEDGTKYSFDEQDVSATLASVGTPSAPQYYASYTGSLYPEMAYSFTYSGKQVSAWWLKSVKSARSAATIDLEYYTDKLYASASRLRAEENQVIQGNYDVPRDCDGFIGGPRPQGFRYSVSIQKNVYLKTIRFENGQVDFGTEPREDIQPVSFTSSPNCTEPYCDLLLNASYITTNATEAARTPAPPQRLTNITVKDAIGTTVKRYVLNQSYYNTDLVGTPVDSKAYYMKKYDNLRLRLNSLCEEGASDAARTPPYVFSYFGDDDATNPTMAAKVSCAKDLFGFGNGKTDNDFPAGNTATGFGTIGKGYYPKLLPDISSPDFYLITGMVKYDGIDRDVDQTTDERHKKRGSLKQITYPLGGTTQFELSSHEAFGGKGDIPVETYQLSINNAGNEVRDNILYTATANKFYELQLRYTCQQAVLPNGTIFGCQPVEATNKIVFKLLRSGQTVTTVRFDEFGSRSCSTSGGGGGGTTTQYCKATFNLNQQPLTPGNYRLELYGMQGIDNMEAELIVTEYKNQDYKVVKLGGLRIDKVITDNGAGNRQTKKFTYLTADGSTSSGKQMTQLRRFGYGYIEMIRIWGLTIGTPTVYPTCRVGIWETMLRSQSMSPLGTSAGGNHVGYSRVKVENLNESGQATEGSTVYEYENRADVQNFNQYYSDAPSFPYLGNGMLLNERHYSSTGSLMKEVLYKPQRAAAQTLYAGLKVSWGTAAFNDQVVINPLYYQIPAEFWYNKSVLGNYVRSGSQIRCSIT